MSLPGIILFFVVAMIDIFYLNRRPQKMIENVMPLAYGGLFKFLFLYSLDHRTEYRMFI